MDDKRELRSQSRVDTRGQRIPDKEERCCATVKLTPNCATEARQRDRVVEQVMLLITEPPLVNHFPVPFLHEPLVFGSEGTDPPGRWFRSSQKVLLTRFEGILGTKRAIRRVINSITHQVREKG